MNKKFLARYGDMETREKLSTINGPHEEYLLRSPLPASKKMLDSAIKSPNYNINVAAAQHPDLSHEQMNNVVDHGYSDTLGIMVGYRNDIPHETMLKIIHAPTTFEGEPPKVSQYKIVGSPSFNEKLANHVADMPNFHHSLALSASGYNKETQQKLRDSIIKHSDTAAALSLLGNLRIHDSIPEPILSHFDHPSLHSAAARNTSLTDTRFSEYLKDPELKEKMRTNISLTDEQIKKVPGHMFTELGI